MQWLNRKPSNSQMKNSPKTLFSDYLKNCIPSCKVPAEAYTRQGPHHHRTICLSPSEEPPSQTAGISTKLGGRAVGGGGEQGGPARAACGILVP